MYKNKWCDIFTVVEHVTVAQACGLQRVKSRDVKVY